MSRYQATKQYVLNSRKLYQISLLASLLVTYKHLTPIVTSRHLSKSKVSRFCTHDYPSCSILSAYATEKQIPQARSKLLTHTHWSSYTVFIVTTTWKVYSGSRVHLWSLSLSSDFFSAANRRLLTTFYKGVRYGIGLMTTRLSGNSIPYPLIEPRSQNPPWPPQSGYSRMDHLKDGLSELLCRLAQCRQ